jgi:hypothetical protein
MRRVILSLAAALAASFGASQLSVAATADQEAAFINAYKTAFAAKDAAGLQALLYTGGDPMAAEFYGQMMTAEMADGKITSIELKDLTPEDETNAAQIQDGPTGKVQLLPKPYKKLVLTIETKTDSNNSTSNSEVFVADFDGKIVISVPAPVK